MRIIAGALKGRRLAPVKGRIRPTGAKVREAVFSILGPAVGGLRVLDLFSGTGALGIEALSRGAATAVFVEDHPESLKVLCRNLADLDLADRTTVWPLPVAMALKKLADRGEVFGLAFLDPPYGGGMSVGVLGVLEALDLLAPGARVVVEHSRRESLPETCGGLTRLTVRRYGDTQVAFYLMAATDEPLAQP
jgi:16S rRNA (guanine(966)-N(2))-methyltransferase RsmD